MNKMRLCYSPTCYFNRLNEDEKNVLRAALGVQGWSDICKRLLRKVEDQQREIERLKCELEKHN